MVATLNTGCSESYCLQKFPGIERRETVFFDTTIITSTKSFDTLIRVSSPDTIFLRDAKTRIQFQVVRVKGDTVFLKTQCPPDTITIERIRMETNIERIRNIVHNNWKKFTWPTGLLALLLFAAGFLIRSIRKK